MATISSFIHEHPIASLIGFVISVLGASAGGGYFYGKYEDYKYKKENEDSIKKIMSNQPGMR